MVDRRASMCPYCQRKIGWADRLQSAEPWAIIVLVPAAVALGSFGGWVAFHTPAPIASFVMSAAICGWYALRLMLCQPADALQPAS